MEPLKILLAFSEVVPFEKTGGLADVAGSLPLVLSSLGCSVKVFSPYYRQTKVKDFGIHLAKNNLKADLGTWNSSFGLYTCKKKGVDFYFIEKDEYYDREFIYGTPTGDYPDNALRFGFFANAILSSAISIDFKPDIIHCNDWQTALLAFYIKHQFKNCIFLKNAKTIFTIHNLAYQGLFPKESMSDIGIDYNFFTPEALEFWGKLSFIKSGIIYSDAISTVSHAYAKEILTEEFGCGLEGLLRIRQDNLYGIINGVDYSCWNPKTDKYIKRNYDKNSLANKLECKEDLLKEVGLPLELNNPLLGVVSRLAEQKGVDIIAESIDEIINLGCRLIILGIGDEKYHKLLEDLSRKYPQNLYVKIAFDNQLAHKIEAGCDMFLMPSRYEPCGLNQMYSLKYGTVPVVRAIGGLDDVIVDYSQGPAGNGFKFKGANPDDFIKSLSRAVSLYKDNKKWKKLIIKAMDFDFSWEKSAQEYIKLYNKIGGRQ